MRFRFPPLLAVLLLVPMLPHVAQGIGDDVSDNVIASFPIPRDGDALFLPVEIDGKAYHFLVDTGASMSMFDSTLPLGRHLQTVKAEAAAGDFVNIEIREPPTATIGPLSFNCPGGVGSLDLTALRQVVGQDFHGLIGMDFLKTQILQIDPDAKELRFLTGVSPSLGAHRNMAYDRQSVPHVLLRIAEPKDEVFMLDTGLVSFRSGSLSKKAFAQLESSRELTIVGHELLETLSGTQSGRIGRAKKLAFGEMEIADPVFGESGGNKVGVKFLSRFIATLDFPAERLYLKKGRRYCEADLWDLSGLHVWRKHGTIVIHSVDKDSVAARAGLQANDSLVKCDDRDTAKMSLEEIRLRCCQTGPLFLVVVRRNEEKVVKLELKR